MKMSNFNNKCMKKNLTLVSQTREKGKIPRKIGLGISLVWLFCFLGMSPEVFAQQN